MTNVVSIKNNSKTASGVWLDKNLPNIIKGDDYNLSEFWESIDWSQNNTDVFDILIKQKVISKRDISFRETEAMKNKKITDEIGFLPEDASDYVNQYIERNEITVDVNNNISDPSILIPYNGKFYKITDHPFAGWSEYVKAYTANKEDIVQFGTRLFLTADKLQLGYSKALISDVVSMWSLTSYNKQIAALSIKMSFDADLVEKMDPYWTAIEDTCFTDLPSKGFGIATLQSYIWQVKRKMLGLNVTNEIMPVITGAQQKGKSSFVRDNFITPITGYWADGNFAEITDNRNIDMWNNLSLFCDEMSYVSKADINVIKQKITSKHISGRPMCTNKMVTKVNRVTMIGTANESLAELVYDETGVRRFVELIWSNDAPKNAFPVINDIAEKGLWMDMWKSVDTYGPNPLNAFTDSLKVQQESNRAKSAIELWMADNGCNHAYKYENFASNKDLFDNFLIWNAEHKMTNKPYTSSTFFKAFNRILRTDNPVNVESIVIKNVRGYIKIN